MKAPDDAGALDVAAVVAFPPGYHPDAPRAEVQALFYLAGWREHPTPGLAPCLVCIDEPPRSVCWLAEQAGARLLRTGAAEAGFHRARGWEAFPGERERRLVLDAEVLVLGDPGCMRAGLGRATRLAAAPATRAALAQECWPAIYRAVGVPLPAERMQPLRAALGLPKAGKATATPPLYHPAALLTARGDPSLGTLWDRHAARLLTAWPALEGLSQEQRASAATRERVALATAVQAWRTRPRGGAADIACEPLPHAWNGRRVFIQAGVPLGEFALLHLPGLFGELTELAQISMWLEACAVRWRAAGSIRNRWWLAWQTRRMEAALRRLYERHVRPALRMGGEFG